MSRWTFRSSRKRRKKTQAHHKVSFVLSRLIRPTRQRDNSNSAKTGVKWVSYTRSIIWWAGMTLLRKSHRNSPNHERAGANLLIDARLRRKMETIVPHQTRKTSRWSLVLLKKKRKVLFLWALLSTRSVPFKQRTTVMLPSWTTTTFIATVIVLIWATRKIMKTRLPSKILRSSKKKKKRA